MGYPGQGTPSPAIGVPNLVPTPVGPAVGVANRTPQYTPPPVVAQTHSSGLQSSVPSVGQAKHNPNPYNNAGPVIGVPKHTPIQTPLGVNPHFETPTQDWSWDYGNGGGY